MAKTNKSSESNHITLLLHCPDQIGIVANITQFIFSKNGNILSLDQHVDSVEKRFFIRVVWDLKGFSISRDNLKHEIMQFLNKKIQDFNWQLSFPDSVPRIAIFVSRYEHCCYELLSRYESKEWRIEIPLIISNHDKLRTAAERLNIPYYHIPITKENKKVQEHKQLELLRLHNIDLIVLARYMQILSENFVDQHQNKIINIHHSFLPAFMGADPYRSAYERGVKFIGATAHYVTTDLDEGPIISQDVISISHRDSISDMKRKGRSIEKLVLAQGVLSHISNKVISHRNKTVVFD